MAAEVVSLWSAVGDRGVGREAELSTLLREHQEARRTDRARFVFVRGPAGVGKSHLFRAARRAWMEQGIAVFEAASARELSRPLGVFAHLVGDLLEHVSHSGVSSERVAQLSSAVAPLLGQTSEPTAEDGRLRMLDGTCELLCEAGRSHPVFLFPDLDVADRSSLELFRLLAAVLTAPEARSGGLFVVSFRDDGPLPAPLAEVTAKVSARSIALGGLDVEGIRGFLSRPDVAQHLLEATGGNPEALEQLLRHPVVAPEELFLRRVARLSEGETRLLELLALAPGGLPLNVLEGARTRLGEVAQVTAAELDRLVRAHLVAVKVVEGQALYRFDREREKNAFAEQLSGTRALAGRRALGEELGAHGDWVGASALLWLTDAPGAGAAATIKAAQQLESQGAYEDASEQYERALPHLGEEERFEISLRLSQLFVWQGELRRALKCLLQARGASRREVQLPVARVLLRMGRLSLAAPLLRQALSQPEVGAEAAVALAELELLRGRLEEVQRLVGQHLDALVSSPALQIALRNVAGKAHLIRGEWDSAQACFAQNQAAAFDHHLPPLAAQAQLNLGVVAQKRGEREQAVRLYQSVSSAHRQAQAQAFANLGSIYADSGDFELAHQHLSRALQVISRFGSKREVSQYASNLARLNHFLGDLERAAELSEFSLRLATEIGEPYLQASALLNLGAVCIDRRELVEALSHLERARERFESLGQAGFGALAVALKARAHLSAGERAQASVELSRKVLDKGGGQLPAAMVETELARAELCLALEDLHGAGRAAARAKDALLSQPELEGPYRVYFVMAKLRQAAGDASGAQTEMARACRLLEELAQRVSPSRRQQFLAVPRRSELLAAKEPELRLPTSAVLGRETPSAHGLIGRSASLQKITRQLAPIGRANTTVLIRGESGTGKELLAEAVHVLSPRKGMPLVKVNCAAMVEELLLSELFGHEKGAFTGAVRERKGRFELADGGTLFLDEIGDISPKCQVALLRVLQEREFERVGGTKTLKVDVRVICATNRDLETLITQGRFRQDLYYRLKGVMLELPPLRERMEDLPVLCEHFLQRLAKERNQPGLQLAPESLELLARHPFPGNVRELENVLASASIFAEGALITPECFSHIAELSALMGEVVVPARPVSPAPAPAVPARAPTTAAQVPAHGERGDLPLDYYQLAQSRGLSLKQLRHEVEMQCIRTALENAQGNISEAARLLKMKRSRLSQIVNGEPALRAVAHGD